MKYHLSSIFFLLALIIGACGLASPGAGQAEEAIRQYFEEASLAEGGNQMNISEMTIVEILPAETGENEYKVLAEVQGYSKANKAVPGDQDESIEQLMAFLLVRENDKWAVGKFYGSVSPE